MTEILSAVNGTPTLGQAPRSLDSHRQIRTTVLAHHAALSVHASKIEDIQLTLMALQKVLDEGMAPALRAVTQNHGITADRLDRFENRTFWLRLRWLFTGR